MRRRLIPILVVLVCLSSLASCSSLAPERGLAGEPGKQGRGGGQLRGGSGPEGTVDPAAAPVPRPKWKKRLDRLVPNRKMSVHVRYGGGHLYSHDARNRRIPASNEKLMLTMALFDALGPDHRIETDAGARRVRKGVVRGDLWIRGRGDPSLSKGGGHAAVLKFGATRINALVRKLKKAGIKRVNGDVMGSTRLFARDWNAPGWKSFFNETEVGLPTALTLNGNVYRGHYTKRPELILAKLFKKRLRKAGIAVRGSAGKGRPSLEVETIASIDSVPLGVLARFMNRVSSNFFAETLGKLLDLRLTGPPGRISGAARAIRRWASDAGVDVKAFDSSGLSYDNRISPRGLVKLLEVAEDHDWIGALRHGLPKGGQGTLEERFPHVRLRAKTGTLESVSTLSGWVWLRREKSWAQFSIMSRGFDKSRAVELENKIVRLLSRRAH